ncbi:MAG: phytanoyl-CoA dioxygenase family protein [Pseudomonadota bacterium]
MTFNRQPLQPITSEQSVTYARDGVVCLRNVFDPDWIDSLLQPARRIVIDKEDVGLLPTLPGRYMARVVPEFRRFVFESPLAEASAKTIDSREVRFFFDEFFAKPPQSDAKTIWHTDRMGWPTVGKMVPSLWVPLTPITKANSLEVLLGSHTEDKRYWLFSPNARQMIRPDDRLPHPDCESLRGKPGYTFKTWDMNPGDMLVVHPWVLHYSGGNPTDDWRIAVSIRVFGDDIRWAPRPDCLNLAGVSFDEMLAGEKPAGSHFPLLWSTDGRHDSDEHYPRGFATTWQQQEMNDINEYKLFGKLRVNE